MIFKSININFFIVFYNFGLKLVLNQNVQAQFFFTEPSNQSVILGETTILYCRVRNRAGTIQWTRDGFGLGIERNLNGFPRYSMIGDEVEGDYSLEINPVVLEDDAFFQCQVTASNGVPAIRSRSAFLTVYVAPEPPIIVQSKAQGDILRTTSGTVIELICESNGGKPAPELYWYYSDGTIISSKNITSSYQLLSDGKRLNTESKWTFVATKDFDNKTINCRSENYALKQPLNTSIRLDVKYAPEVELRILEPIGQIKVGDTVVLLCEATANPSNLLLYKWLKNDEIIIGDHNNKLTLVGVDKLSNGVTIACQVSNSVGLNRALHTMDVAFGPILKMADNQIFGVDMSREMRLKCEIEGNPKPDITWLKFGNTDVLSKESELLIKNIDNEKLGKYICRASVKGFAEISSQQIIAINGPPYILQLYPNYGLKGETLKIYCYFVSVPKPTHIQWYHKKEILNIDIKGRLDIFNDSVSGELTLISILVIQNSKSSDFGDYNCSVWNQYGSDSKILIVEEQISMAFLITIASSLLSMLALIIFITILTILCLRRKQFRRQKKFDLSLSSNQLSDSSLTSNRTSTTSSSFEDKSESNINQMEMQSLSAFSNRVNNRKSVRILNQNKRQFYNNNIFFDFNNSLKQYI